MNDILAVRISSRFIFVNLLPTIAVICLVGGLLAAGAPGQAPSWRALEDSISGLTLISALLAAFAVLVASVVLHPLAYPMIKVVEGYWARFPFGAALSLRVSRRYRTWRQDLEIYENEHGGTAEERAWLPPAGTPVLPTGLGNVLQAGEIRAGARYGYRTADIWHRLSPLMSPAVRAEVSDTRNQMDTAARLCVFGLLCVPITMALLWNHEVWLLVPVGCYLFAWAAYRAATAAAYRFCEAAAVAVDFHRLQLWDALSLDRPSNFLEEQTEMAPLLCQVLGVGEGLYEDDMAKLTYSAAPAWLGGQVGSFHGQQQIPPPEGGGGVGAS